MYQGSLWLAVLAPLLWFATVFLLTRRSQPWVRFVWLVAGVAAARAVAVHHGGGGGTMSDDDNGCRGIRRPQEPHVGRGDDRRALRAVLRVRRVERARQPDPGAQLPTGMNGLGWFIWIFAAVFPILAFGAAFALGFRRPAHQFLLVMFTGPGLVAVFWLNVVAYTTMNTASLLG